MNILLLNTSDRQGGADRVAVQLLDGLRRRGHRVKLLVHEQQSDDPDVRVLPASRDGLPGKELLVRAARGLQRLPGGWKAGEALYTFAGGKRQRLRRAGREVFEYPETKRILELADMPVDVLHAHNLHGHYFDLRQLGALAAKVPLLATLHDEWMYTGHCVYTLGCERWKTGCGACPHLDVPHALEADGTAENWRAKRSIYSETKMDIVTPSQWLASRVRESLLGKRPVHVIPNGVDLAVFAPGDRAAARQALGLPASGRIVLCVANRRNVFKDVESLEAAARSLDLPESVTFLCVGGRQAEERILGQHPWRVLPFETDPRRLALAYQAADVFVLGTRADNYPLVTLEAMACGLPAIASDIGGLSEQIAADRGRLVPSGDPESLRHALAELLASPDLREKMSRAARAWAETHADGENMISAYEALYRNMAPHAHA